MKDSILTKIALIFLLNIPVSMCFADATIDAKVAEVRSRMRKDFAPPKASQYLTATSRHNGSNPLSNGASPNAQNPNVSGPNTTPSSSVPASVNQETQDTPAGSWYVQPGDTAPSQNSGSGSSGFNHNNLY